MAPEGYDVLRLIEHNQSCYVSSEYVYGWQLVRWMKYHPNISKQQLFAWMQEAARQLELFHRCRGNPSYQYVNPYSIIVTREQKLYLLDAGTQSGQMQTLKMQRRTVRENFLPPDEPGYQRASIELDIYGLGKTFQYMLAATEPEPSLTKREEHKLQKIISRCLSGHPKKTYHKIQDIRKQIPVYRQEKRKLPVKKVVKRLAAVMCLLGAAGACRMFLDGPEKSPRAGPKEAAAAAVKKEPAEEAGKEDALRFEMGMVYLLETENYEKAEEYLSQIRDETLQDYGILAQNLAAGGVGQSPDGEKKFTQMLESMEGKIPRGSEERCLRSLIRGYSLLDGENAASAVIRLGRACTKRYENEGAMSESLKREMGEYMAPAYERLEETEDAAKEYERLLEMEEEPEGREELYKKIALLWENIGKTDQAFVFCRKGMEEFAGSAELRLLYIQMQCKDKSLDRTICAQTIRETLQTMPKLAEQEAFKKLQREYDIRVEGEEVWVGK